LAVLQSTCGTKERRASARRRKTRHRGPGTQDRERKQTDTSDPTPKTGFSVTPRAPLGQNHTDGTPLSSVSNGTSSRCHAIGRFGRLHPDGPQFVRLWVRFMNSGGGPCATRIVMPVKRQPVHSHMHWPKEEGRRNSASAAPAGQPSRTLPPERPPLDLTGLRQATPGGKFWFQPQVVPGHDRPVPGPPGGSAVTAEFASTTKP